MKIVKDILFYLMEKNEIFKKLEDFLKLKSEGRKLVSKITEYKLQLHAQNGSRFDTRIILNKMQCGRRRVDMIKN